MIQISVRPQMPDIGHAKGFAVQYPHIKALGFVFCHIPAGADDVMSGTTCGWQRPIGPIIRLPVQPWRAAKVLPEGTRKNIGPGKPAVQCNLRDGPVCFASEHPGRQLKPGPFAVLTRCFVQVTVKFADEVEL